MLTRRATLCVVLFALLLVGGLACIRWMGGGKTSNSTIQGYTSQFTYFQGAPLDLRYAADGEIGENVVLTIHRQKGGVEVLQQSIPSRIRVQECTDFKGGGCDFPNHLSVNTDGLEFGPYFAQFKIGESKRSDRIWFSIVPKLTSEYPRVAVLANTFTWQAYNTVGGHSLYTSDRPVPSRVSLNRPLVETSSNVNNFGGMAIFVDQLRKIGLEPVVFDDLAFHEHGNELLAKVDLFLIVDHSEYWTWQMRESLRAFLAGGKHVGVFGGNLCWWKVRVKDNEVLVYKREPDPIKDIEAATGYWHQLGQPEETDFGLSFRFAGYPLLRGTDEAKRKQLGLSESQSAQSEGVTVLRPDHPIFAETGLKAGQVWGEGIPLIYREVDGTPLKLDNAIDFEASPHTPRTTIPLAKSLTFRGELHHPAVMVEVQHPSGAKVLHMGTLGWTPALLKQDEVANKIFANSVRYLLENPKGQRASRSSVKGPSSEGT